MSTFEELNFDGETSMRMWANLFQNIVPNFINKILTLFKKVYWHHNPLLPNGNYSYRTANQNFVFKIRRDHGNNFLRAPRL